MSDNRNAEEERDEREERGKELELRAASFQAWKLA